MTKRSIRLIRTLDLSEHDLKGISQIYMDSFGSHVSTRLLKRKYLSSLGGSSWHGLVYSDRRLIGIYTFTARSVTLSGKGIVLLQSIDTCFPYKALVSPFSIKSLALRLLEKAVEEYSDSAPVFVCGFPNARYESFSRRIFNWQKTSSVRIDICMFPIIRILRFEETIAYRCQSKHIFSWSDNTPLRRITSHRLITDISLGRSIWDVDLLKKPLPVLVFRCRGYSELATKEKTYWPLTVNKINPAIKKCVFLALSVFPALMPSHCKSVHHEVDTDLARQKKGFYFRVFNFYLAALNPSAKKCFNDVEQIPIAFVNDVP